VTINALGGGGGGVTSVTASGPGIGATPTTGAVVLTNTGVTSVAAGAGMTVSAPTGALTVTNSGVTSLVAGPGIAVSGGTGAVTVSAVGLPVFTGLQTFDYTGDTVTYSPTGSAFRIRFIPNTGGGLFVASPDGGWVTRSRINISNTAWNENTFIMIQAGGPPGIVNGFSAGFCGGIVTIGAPPSPDPTSRVLYISGSGPLPDRLSPALTYGDQFLNCIVLQTAA
jgi:hypothetical protein